MEKFGFSHHREAIRSGLLTLAGAIVTIILIFPSHGTQEKHDTVLGAESSITVLSSTSPSSSPSANQSQSSDPTIHNKSNSTESSRRSPPEIQIGPQGKFFEPWVVRPTGPATVAGPLETFPVNFGKVHVGQEKECSCLYQLLARMWTQKLSGLRLMGRVTLL
jgi:hypothetical protein